MTAFFQRWMAKACPRRVSGLLFFIAFLLFWTAMGWALTPPPGASIVNRITLQYADSNGNSLPEVSASASCSVPNSRTPGQIEFFNAAWQPVIGYTHGDTIYLQVKDGDQNSDPSVSESVAVVLRDLKTGDTETFSLAETGPNTGIFRSSGILPLLDLTSSGDGILTVSPNSKIEAIYTDPLDVSPISSALALIDPLGIVFDSVTGRPVAGAIVALRNWNSTGNACDLASLPILPPGQVNPAVPTAADGKFAFPLVTPGDYCFEVTAPSGYVFPSAVPDPELPSGYNVGNGSRGEKFSLMLGDPALIRDIPIDPPPGSLRVTKSAAKTTASVGDIIGYSIKVVNNGMGPVTTIVITDLMPHGVQYLSGSSRIDGGSVADPGVTGQRTFSWSITSLPPAKELEITYRAVVGPDSRKGSAINTAVASGTSLGHSVTSNRASAKITITDGVFTEKGTVLGKVFLDSDRNRIQNQSVSAGGGGKPDEPGIPNVVLYLEDGTRIITDRNGKFSISGITPGTHVLRVDETTLPKGLILKPLSNRFLGDGASQIVNMQPSGLVQADFAAEKEQSLTVAASVTKVLQNNELPGSSSSALPASSEGLTGKVAELRGSAETAPVQSLKPGDHIWEEEIKSMSPDLAFLSPLNGAVLARERIRVVVKAPFGYELLLSLNSSPIQTKQLGRKMEYEKGQVIIYEYIDIHLNSGETNVLKSEARDPFGIVRASEEIVVTAAGAPERIVIKTDRAEVPADGESLINVEVSFLDKNNRVVPYAGFSNVSVSAGEVVEKDADPIMEEFQIHIREGIGRFSLRAPRETGEASITISLDNRRETAKVFFLPNMRKLFMTGIGEVTIGHGQSRGNAIFLRDNSWFNEGAYAGARGAFFLKGTMYDDFLLTAAYDSEKKKRADLFRENDTNLDTESKYPIYGDESKTGYEAVSADRLYLKVEKNRSYLLYGDYKTDLNYTKLSAYNRSFNGLKYELNTRGLKIRAFGSYTDQTQIMDILPGKGISGYYYLTQHPVVEGSERMLVEIRDRYRPDIVISRESKGRSSDYEIDYDLGTVLFKEPIPSHDADYNPVYIVVTYESRAASRKYYIYGGRGSFQIFDWLEVGATGVQEQKEIGDYQLLGADITVKLPRKTIIKGEYAHTKGVTEKESVISLNSADGWAFSLESEAIERLRLSGYYRTLGNYFLNVSAADVMRGTTKYGLDATYQLRPETQLKARYFDEQDDLNSMKHRLASVGIQTKFKKTRITLDVSHESSSDSYIPLSNSNNRSPFDISQETPHELTDVKIGIEQELRTDLSLTLNHRQSLTHESYQMSQLGLKYQLDSKNRLYLREEYQKYQERSEMRTLLGIETQLIHNTVAYSEYRLADGAEGARNQSVLGLRNKFFFGKGLTGNIAAEYLRTISGSQRKNEPDAVAVSLGLEYLASEDFKVTSRAEHRREFIDDGRVSYLAEIGLAYKLNPDCSLLMRERYFMEESGLTGQHTSSRLMIGLAYRPLLANRFNALTKIEYKHESNPGAVPALRETAFIFSGEGVWQATPRLQLTAKYAGKLARDQEFRSYTDLIAARFLFDLTDRWDIGAEYRISSSHAVNSSYQGGTVEIGYRVIKNVWLSIGYSFDRFDADLVGDNYSGSGPFIRMRMKFDESSFRKDMPDRN